MRGRWELSDAQWELIERILRPQRRTDGRGRPWQDTRAVLNGILWVLGTGAQWRELPKKYPPYQTCHRRFQQWGAGGQTGRHLARTGRGVVRPRKICNWRRLLSTPPSRGQKRGARGARRTSSVSGTPLVPLG